MTEKSVASSKSGSKQNYMLQEKTGFEKLSAEIKDSVFQVLYLILKEEEDSLLSFFFNVSADYLQMAAFAFNSNVNSVWKATSFMNFIFNFFNWFQLQTYFSAAFTFTSYLISFYLTVAVIVLMFINIIYVSWAFSKKRVSAIWPVMVLRSVTSLLCTVFFLPTTELLLTMVECSYDGDGVYVNSNYTDVRCFVDAHIIHSVVAIIVIFLFSILGFVVALAYFEIRMLTEDPTARQHSRGDVLFIANKVVLQLSFSFFSASMQWWLVLILAGGALILWYSYNIDEPYYRKEPTLFFKILTNYYLWTCLLVLASKVLENTTFDGGLVTWLVGMPFIGVILVSSTKSRITSLVQSASRFKTSNDLMDHIRFVLQLVDLYNTDKSARILLTGYVEKHKDTCEEEDCPLKLKRKKRMSLGSEADEMSLGLILVADRMYQVGLKKFKNSAKLRIFYAIFLLERMKKMKKAEQELAKAKECNPGFEDQFVIFRLSKMIADGMEGVDVVGLIAWDNYKNLYQEFVRESANLHKEFWSELHEDSPNLHKLNYLGSRVNNAMSLAREYWNKVQRVRTDDPVILKTYGRFLIDIQNDVVEGYDLIEKAKKQVSQRISHNFAKRNSFDAGLDSLPYVEVVGSGQEMGKIKQANLLFTVLVGVNRDEILEKKVNLFMPDFFSQYHDSFLKRFNNREEDYDIGYLDKDNNLFVRSRSGYIIPVTLRVSRLKTEEATNQIVFGAWFKTETAKRTYVHLICSKDGTISDISASAVTVLNLSLQNVKKTRMNIDKIVPHALTDKGYREGGKEITYKLNDTTTLSFIAQITPITIKDERNLDFFEAYSSQNPGKPLTAADMAYGFIIKLDKLDKAGENTLMAQMDMSKLSSAKKRTKKETIMSAGFERENSMRSDPSRASKVENLGDNTKAENDGQIIFGFNTEYAELEISELFQNDGGVKLDIDALVKQEDHVERVQINYGEGVNLKKFIKGRLYDIRNDTEEGPPPVEDDDEGSLFLRRDDDDFDTGLNKKRKDKLSALKRLVRDALEASQKNSTVSTIRWITFFWLATLYTIGILQYTLLSSLFGNYQNEIHVIQSFTQKLTEVDNINSYLTDFITFSTDSQVLAGYAESNYTTRAQEMQDCVNRIVTLTKELEQGSYYSIISPLIEGTVEVTVYGAEENEVFTMNQTEAIFFISSRAYNLLTLMEGSVTTTNPEVMTVLSNYYNTILPALRSSTSALQRDLKNKLNSFEAEFLVLFILNGMVALVLSIWGMGVLIRIDQQKEDVLFLFLEIPLNNVDGISRKRDKFIEFFDITIRQLQTNNEGGAPANDDGTDSDSLDEKRNMTANGNGGGKENVFDDSLKDGALRSRDPDNREEVEDALKDRKKLIKKFKANQFAKAKSGLLKVLCLSVFSLVYSISSTASIIVNKNELSNYSDQFFTTNLLSDNILTALNLNRLMRLDPDFKITNQNTVLASYDSLIQLNSLGNDLGEFFLYVIRTNNKLEYEVTSLFFGDACEFITSDQAGCEESLSRALKLGVFNLKEQVLKILMEEYTAFIDTSATSTEEYITLMSLNDEFKTYTFNILQQFNINEEDYLKGILDSAASLQEILLIVYLVIITILIVIFWLPYLSRLNAEVWRTTRMINMIPLDVVNNTLNIKRYLKGLIRG